MDDLGYYVAVSVVPLLLGSGGDCGEEGSFLLPGNEDRGLDYHVISVGSTYTQVAAL